MRDATSVVCARCACRHCFAKYQMNSARLGWCDDISARRERSTHQHTRLYYPRRHCNFVLISFRANHFIFQRWQTNTLICVVTFNRTWGGATHRKFRTDDGKWSPICHRNWSVIMLLNVNRVFPDSDRHKNSKHISVRAISSSGVPHRKPPPDLRFYCYYY